MKTIRKLVTYPLFLWIYCKFQFEEFQREARRHVYRIVPRYPMKKVRHPARRKCHPLDDPRLAQQRWELN